MSILPEEYNPLEEQLIEAAKKFSPHHESISNILLKLLSDVECAFSEPLELFPVCHHSPASALQMVRRLYRKPPKVIYIELCEDLFETILHLKDCTLPVALQAFALKAEGLPKGWAPLSVVAPMTTASAEYQAMAFALQNSEIEIVFVDRAVDFVFQWINKESKPGELHPDPNEETYSEDANMHGTAIGLQIGDITPTFEQFLTFLLNNANVRHFAEWWDQYVENTIINADYTTYRKIMFLIGSLFRRLGAKKQNIEEDRLRERYMWTKIKSHLQTSGISPSDAIFICGAAHTVNDVDEYGVESKHFWEIPEKTLTEWKYGVIPSSFAAIEYQFGNPPGTVSIAKTIWEKNLVINKITPFHLTKKKKKVQSKTELSPPKPTISDYDEPDDVNKDFFITYLTSHPEVVEANKEELIQRCINIVSLARKNGYLATTADTIAIYETSMLLANIRNRSYPSPYDFQDAAITCLEKDMTPKKRNISQLCQILLGGNRVGVVGYSSLPPLVQNIIDRFSVLPKVNLMAKTIQRALLDFKVKPELKECSDILWRLNYLLGDGIVQPIMGERKLGETAIQESWDIRIGKYQGSIIQLGYEGATLEYVLENRIKKQAFTTNSRSSTVLLLIEVTILYLETVRLSQELGERAIFLLQTKEGTEDAPLVFKQIRKLIHYYRSTTKGLPEWIHRFIATGYSHYNTQIPFAFEDKGTSPKQIAGMLGFVFTLENLALSIGSSRTQLDIAIQQVNHVSVDPEKLGLLWTAEWLLKKRSLDNIRNFFSKLLQNQLMLPNFPKYLNGFLLALQFAPNITGFVVEIISRVFEQVPDRLLMPWLPNLILRLQSHSDIMKIMLREASKQYPQALIQLEAWIPPWTEQDLKKLRSAQISLVQQDGNTQIINSLLFTFQDSTNAMASLIGVNNKKWIVCNNEKLTSINTNPSETSTNEIVIQSILNSKPETLNSISKLLQRENEESNQDQEK